MSMMTKSISQKAIDLLLGLTFVAASSVIALQVTAAPII